MGKTRKKQINKKKTKKKKKNFGLKTSCCSGGWGSSMDIWNTGVRWLETCFIVGLLVAVLKVDGDVVDIYPVDVLGVVINLLMIS